MGLGLSAGVSYGAASATGSLTDSWGSSSSDTSATQIDQSRERRETQGSTTSITQQYNLLTGYHVGTNRATFLMLPRPHTLQATDYRTFVRGLRMIEGIQEFFMIVSRPVALPGICIEASLETGHFPETAPLAPPFPSGPPPQTKTAQQTILAYAPGGNVLAQYSNTTAGGSPVPNPATYTPPSGWLIDTVTTPPAGANGGSVQGVSWTLVPVDGNYSSYEFQQAVNSAKIAVTSALDGASVTVSIIVNSAGVGDGYETDARANVVLTYSLIQASSAVSTTAPADPEQDVVVSDFLVTSRELRVCINSCSTTNCINIVAPEQVPYVQNAGATGANGLFRAASTAAQVKPSLRAGALSPAAAPGPQAAALGVPPTPASAFPVPRALPAPKRATVEGPAASNGSRVAIGPSAGDQSSIVYETKLKLARSLLSPGQLQRSRTPAARELMQAIRHHMLSSWRLPQRRAYGAVGFVDSDYVCRRRRARLPIGYLRRRVSDVRGIPPELTRRFGPEMTVGDVLRLDLHQLQTRGRLDLNEATRLRRALLGLGPRGAEKITGVARAVIVRRAVARGSLTAPKALPAKRGSAKAPPGRKR